MEDTTVAFIGGFLIGVIFIGYVMKFFIAYENYKLHRGSK